MGLDVEEGAPSFDGIAKTMLGEIKKKSPGMLVVVWSDGLRVDWNDGLEAALEAIGAGSLTTELGIPVSPEVCEYINLRASPRQETHALVA